MLCAYFTAKLVALKDLTDNDLDGFLTAAADAAAFAEAGGGDAADAATGAAAEDARIRGTGESDAPVRTAAEGPFAKAEQDGASPVHEDTPRAGGGGDRGGFGGDEERFAPESWRVPLAEAASLLAALRQAPAAAAAAAAVARCDLHAAIAGLGQDWLGVRVLAPTERYMRGGPLRLLSVVLPALVRSACCICM